VLATGHLAPGGGSKREIEINREFPRPFGNLSGNLWQEGMVALPQGVAIQALGRDMSVTGMNYLETRPDASLVDEIKDPEEVRV
jgi:hypothetical protein